MKRYKWLNLNIVMQKRFSIFFFYSMKRYHSTLFRVINRRCCLNNEDKIMLIIWESILQWHLQCLEYYFAINSKCSPKKKYIHLFCVDHTRSNMKQNTDLCLEKIGFRIDKWTLMWRVLCNMFIQSISDQFLRLFLFSFVMVEYYDLLRTNIE